MSALPSNEEELALRLADPMWRLSNLYKILIKGENGQPDLVKQFKPNRAQRRFIERMWHRNIILKARQLGFTTLIAILWLDHALFNANQRCGIVAQDKDAAELIFRDKVKFAYENLPDTLRSRFPLAKDSASELLFAHNNSSVRVATSMRGGTLHRLHVSEFGKICAKFPEKAREVVTGSFPAVPENGVIIIESTAEGREGAFYAMSDAAEKLFVQKIKLTTKDYRFHFYPWHEAPEYRLDSTTVNITLDDHTYFDTVEHELGVKIDPDQRAWYVKTRNSDFGGSSETMWQEYPSTPSEPFQVSTEGNYYSKQMVSVRKQGRILRFPVVDAPVNTFWDIGNGDGCGIWLHQEVTMQDRFIGYIEGHNEDLRHYVGELQKLGYIWNKHFLPHDANHKRLGDTNRSVKQMLEGLNLRNIVIIPRITDLTTGIQTTRKHFATAFFEEVACKLGIQRLDTYRKKWSTAEGRFTDVPDKSNGASEGADAFRQYAQAKEAGLITPVATQITSAPPLPPDWRL